MHYRSFFLEKSVHYFEYVSYILFLAEFLSLCPIKGFDIPMLKKKSKILILMDHKSVKEKKLAVVFVDPPTQNCVIHHNKWRNEDLTVRRRAGLDKRKILMVFSFALVKLNLSSFGDLKAPKFGKAWKLAATSKVLWRQSWIYWGSSPYEWAIHEQNKIPIYHFQFGQTELTI